MAGFKLNVFSGIQPRLPDSLLPERAATIARNCDFAYGELRNTKAGYQVNGSAMANSPQSIYTDDGTAFYTWAADVNAVRSPLVADTFNRLYYSDGSTLKVGTRASQSATGGTPPTPYNVGVPRPTVPPTLAVSIPDVTDDTKYTLAFRFHYEYGGVKYQEQSISPTILSGTQAQFTPPSMTKQVAYETLTDFPATGASGIVYKASDTNTLYTWGGSSYSTTTVDATPVQAFPVLRMTVTLVADDSEIADVYSDNSSFNSTGSLWSVALVNDSGAATYTATLSTGIKESDKETRAYVYTFVNTYGEEGPPSDPVLVTTSPVVDVNITVTLDSTTGYAPIKEIRIYRTPTGSTIAQYFYVESQSVLGQSPGTFTVLDNVRGEQLNEELASLYYYPPPSGLVGLMTLPNGILCAWKANELWFSEAYKPWAWPPTYVKPLPNAIVGGIAHGSGAIITTTANPYAVSGVSPDAMTTSRINVDQAGVSKWSLAVVDGAAMYASHDGLVVLNGGTASLVQSQKFFTRDVWRTRYAAGLSGMRFSVWDGRLIVFHAAGAFTPFMIRLDEADGTLTDLPDFSAKCAFVSQLSDQCYYALGTNIYQFNGGSDQTATWQSREVVLLKPVNFGVIQTVTTGSWTIYFYADGVLKHTQAVAEGKNVYRLPSGYKSDRWQYKITGTGRFRELRVAQAGSELASL